MIKRTLTHTFTLLNVDQVSLGPKWNYKNVISPYFRIYYISAGEGEISDISNRVTLEPGYLYMIPSFTLCNLSCRRHLSQFFVQFFEESSDGSSLFAGNRSVFKVPVLEADILNFARLLEINPGRGINRSDNPRIYEKNFFYKEYQQLNNTQSTATFTETHGIILQLVSRFLRPEIFRERGSAQIPDKILQAISYVQLNLHQEITVAKLAEMAMQNVDHFSRSFQKYTGDRPSKYIHEKRVERAQYLMATTQLANAEIAIKTGFENLFYFSKIFKKITGLPPGIYRKQLELEHI